MSITTMLRPCAVVLLLAATSGVTTSVGAAPASLDGWGAFKFGITPDQARKVPGQEFGRYSRKDLQNRDIGAMASKNPVPMYGVPYSFDLFFNSFQALYEIGMWNEKTTTRGDCEAAFLTLLSRLEKDYGGFSPVNPQAKKNDQDVLPIELDWRKAPGASRYQLATVYLNEETASAWEARRNFAARYVDAAAVWSAGTDDATAPCLVEMDFKG